MRQQNNVAAKVGTAIAVLVVCGVFATVGAMWFVGVVKLVQWVM